MRRLPRLPRTRDLLAGEPHDVGEVVELGGQDAKIIVFKEDQETGKKKKIPSMNDKCAGGTGAAAALGPPIEERVDRPDGVFIRARLPQRELRRFAPFLVAEAHVETARSSVR